MGGAKSERMSYRFVALLTALAYCALGAPGGAQTALLAPFAQAWGAISTYHTMAHVYQVKGTQTQNSVYDYTFTKPSSISMQIVSGPNSGASVTWSGGDSVRAGKGMFTKSVALTDPLVTSLRGLTIVQLSFGDILQHAQQTAGTLGGGTTTMGGTPYDVVNLNVANPSADGGLTRETIYLSQTTHLPVRVDGFAVAQLVQTVSFSDTSAK
jgi:outer membrane lipoprotein-sorting protein